MKTIKHILLIAAILSLGSMFVSGQGLFDKLKNKVKADVRNQSNVAGAAEADYHFARVQVNASWEEKGETKYEVRVYYSNISKMNSAADLRELQNFEKWFDDGIVAPMKARGIELKYYDSDVSLYPLTVPYDSLEEAQKQKDERLAGDKSNEFAIYDFIWDYNGKAAGEASTKPKRVFSVKPAPPKEK